MIEKVINLLRGKRMAQPPEVSHDTWAEEMHKAYMERLEQLKDQTDFPADEKVMGRLLPLLVRR